MKTKEEMQNLVNNAEQRLNGIGYPGNQTFTIRLMLNAIWSLLKVVNQLVKRIEPVTIDCDCRHTCKLKV